MSNPIASLITIVNEANRQAQYISTSVSDKPTINCALPTLVAPPTPLGSITPPNNVKTCLPLFIEFPLVVDPFPLPENCPNGISFNPTPVSIFAQVSDIVSNTPAGSITVGASQADSVCNFNIDFPPVVIPCFPTGPQLSSTATITVVDPNQSTVVTTSLAIVKDHDVPCNWQFVGDPVINLPQIPCPDGISFKNAPLDIRTSPTGPVVDRSIVTLAPDPDNSCSFDLTLPPLTIPCYPDGPNVSGSVDFTITDSVNSSTHTSSISVTQSNSVPCQFNFGGGPILIDIPCKDTGPVLTVAPWVISDPYFGGTHSLTTSVTKPDLCHITLTPPPIDIPCYPNGIQFNDPISFAGYAFADDSGNTPAAISSNIDLTDAGGMRDPAAPCSWNGTTVNLPIPVCDGGFVASNSVNVKLNSNYSLPITTPDNPNNLTRYNAIELKKVTTVTSGKTQCGFELSGELNLGLPPIASCANLTIGQNPVTISIGPTNNPSTWSTATLQMHAASLCDYEFTSSQIHIPALNCDSFSLNPTTYTAGPFAGQPITLTVATASGAIQQNNLKLVSADPTKPFCSLAISGVLDLTSFSGGGGGGGGSGTGIGSASWSNNGNNSNSGYNSNSSVTMVYPEGDKASFNALANTTTEPGTADAEGKWKEQFLSVPGAIIPPFGVVKCKETIDPAQFTTVNTAFTATDSTEYVKVVPQSYLFNGEASIGRYHVFGLDTPFKMSPGHVVYLEVVFAPTNYFGETNVVYAAVCRGLAKDFDIGQSSSRNYIPATTTTYKLLTPAQASAASTTDLQNYYNSSVAQIVGIDNNVAQDLIQLQKAALNAIKARGSSDTTNYQFKAYIPIAYAEYNIPTAPLNGVTVSKSLGSHVSLVNAASTSYAVKQMTHSHLTLRATNNNSVPLKIIVPAIDTTIGNMISTDAIQSNSTPTFSAAAPGSHNAKVDAFAYSTAPNSALQQSLITLLTQLAPTYTPVGITTELAIGVKSNNIHIYYTLDGSIPTVNTHENQNSFRYDPANPPANINRTANPRINWMAIYPEFSTAPYCTINTPLF
jgi:hypothetical protein